MKLDTAHPQYEQAALLWSELRDVIEGENAVKSAGTAYLPRLGGQEKDEYEAYKTRASFYNATGRTIDGLSGMIFRKPVDVQSPAGMDDFLADVTLHEMGFQGFAESIVEEVLSVGRAGMLVDFPRVEAIGITQAQAERMNLRPFLMLYRAEAILDWRVSQIGNKTMLSFLKLKETVHERIDEFNEEEIDQIRVLDIDSGQYRQRLFRQDVNGDWQQFGLDIVPLMEGQAMPFIPFIFVGTRDTATHVSKPPLIDLADKNLDHYRMDADYHHSLHFLAAGATRWVKGVEKDEIDAGVFDKAGPTALLASTSPEAEFGICEPQGNGIPAQRQALKDAEDQMAALGARMLAPEKRQAEAAETAAIHRQGEISVLSSLAQAVSIALTRVLEIARDWMGVVGEVAVTLNRDYFTQKLSAQEMAEYLKQVQGGELSYETFARIMIEGERWPADVDIEEEQERAMNNEFVDTAGSRLQSVT